MMIPGKLKYPERIPIHAANNITADLTKSDRYSCSKQKSHTVAAFILHDKKSYYFKNNTVYNTSENQIK